MIAPSYPPLTTMDELVDGIAAILDAEEVSQAFVLGQSYGGGVAQGLIRRHPSRVKKAVLSGTAPLITLRWKKALNSLFLVIMSLLPENMVLNIFRQSISTVITVQESEHAFWDAYLTELFERQLTKADILSHFQTSRDAQTNYSYKSGEENPWDGDVLVIWGENDHLRTERGRNGMLEIFPKPQIHIIPGGGHTVAMSNPTEYAMAVKGFLAEM